MAELPPRVRLRPCLLDRLTDHEPEVGKESWYQHAMSWIKYRDSVRRDLEMLLNSKKHHQGDTIYEFSKAEQSVLNYGIPDLCGTTISAISSGEFEAEVKKSILLFEPRILHESLSVKIVSPSDTECTRTVSFEIEGKLWAQPSPENLFIKTEVDLETGHHRMKDESSG
jgi:type VI secretion system protein ImpF